MLSAGQRLLLEHFNSTTQNDKDQWEMFLGILDFKLRTNQGLDAATIAHLYSCDAILSNEARRTLGSAIKFAQRVVETEEHIQMSLIVAMLYERHGLGSAHGLRIDMAKCLLHCSNQISDMTISLLVKNMLSSMLAFLTAIINANQWSKPVVTLLSRIIRTCDPFECTNIIEGLPVLYAEEISFLMDLVTELGPSIDTILCIHDQLVKFGFPLTQSERFSEILTAEILRLDGGNSVEWAIANMCSNIERFLTNCDDRSLPGVVTIATVLIMVENVNVDRLLGAVNRALLPFRQLESILVSKIAHLVCANTNFHLAKSQEIWSTLCQNQLISEHVLNCIKNVQKPWLLYHNHLVSFLDFRIPQDPFIRAKALCSLENLLLCLLRSGHSISKDLCDTLFLHLSILLKSPFSSTSAASADFSRSNYSQICDLVADMCLYQIRSSWKTWKQIVAEYSFSAPWLTYGNTIWHWQIPPNMYRKWIGDLDLCSVEVMDFLATYRDIVFSTAIHDFLNWSTPNHGILFSDYKKYFSLNGPLAATISTEPKNQKIWSLLPSIILRALDAATIGQVEIVLEVLDSSFNSHVIEQIIIKAMNVIMKSQCCDLRLLASVSKIVVNFGTPLSVDELDLMLHSIGFLDTTLFPARLEIPTNIADFLLTRLTSIVLAKSNVDLISSANMLSLVRGILKSLPPITLYNYMINVLPLLSELRSSPFLSKFHRFVMQVILERSPKIKGLPLEFFNIATSSPLPPPVESNESCSVSLCGPVTICSEEILQIRLMSAIRSELGKPGIELSLSLANRMLGQDQNHITELELAANGFVDGCIENHPLFHVFLK